MAEKFSEDARVVGQIMLSPSVMRMDIIAPKIAQKAVPGQFINVLVSGATAPLLRRPFGVAAKDGKDGTVTFIYRVLGEATRKLTGMCSGDVLNVLGPLGKGFDLTPERSLIVGGGLGLAPLMYLADQLKKEGRAADVLMGARDAGDLFWEDLFDGSAQEIFCTTDDGSRGTKGTVMALLPELLGKNAYGCVYVCGPVPMMRAVSEECIRRGVRCQVSLERYMACGLGACLSCSFTGRGGKRLKVCTDGPVFEAQEVEEW